MAVFFPSGKIDLVSVSLRRAVGTAALHTKQALVCRPWFGSENIVVRHLRAKNSHWEDLTSVAHLSVLLRLPHVFLISRSMFYASSLTHGQSLGRRAPVQLRHNFVKVVMRTTLPSKG